MQIKDKTEMEAIIYYGAGQRAGENYPYWADCVGVPVCFVDKDESKQGTEPANAGGGGIKVLSLQEALEKYTDAEIYITLNDVHYDSVVDSLVGEGVNRDRIHHLPSFANAARAYEAEKEAKWCPLLGQNFFIDACAETIFSYCDEAYRETFPSSLDFSKDIELYKRICERKISQLQNGEISSCAGCFRLVNGSKPAGYPELHSINVSTGIPGGECCNLKCSYCTYRERLDAGLINTEYKQNVYEILLQFSEIAAAPADVHYNCGEITVSANRNQVLELWKEKQFKGMIATNCVCYDSQIAELLSLGLTDCLFVSLDAGTQASYKRIKGVDCFGRVCENIRAYASKGRVKLKYILMRDINDNQYDIDAFIDFAKGVSDTIHLSMDNNFVDRRMNAKEFEMALRFKRLGQDAGMRVEYADSYFHPEDREQMKFLGF
jgi:pyruvate-formate lyase-activating enzyme